MVIFKILSLAFATSVAQCKITKFLRGTKLKSYALEHIFEVVFEVVNDILLYVPNRYSIIEILLAIVPIIL